MVNIVDEIKDELHQYSGEYESFIDSLPDMLMDLFVIFYETENAELKAMVAKPIAYCSNPDEVVIPKRIYGPYGYIPELLICAFTLKHIDKEYMVREGKTLDYFIDKCLEIVNEEELSIIKDIIR